MFCLLGRHFPRSRLSGVRSRILKQEKFLGSVSHLSSRLLVDIIFIGGEGKVCPGDICGDWVTHRL